MPPKQSTALGRPRKYGDVDDSQEVHEEIIELGKQIKGEMMRRNPRANEAQLLEHLQQFGPSEQSKQQLRRELEAAEQSIETGVYFVYRNITGGSFSHAHQQSSSSSSALSKAQRSGATRVPEQECARLGPKSLCFCGHSLSHHEGAPTKKRGGLPPCALCNCQCYEYIPEQPSEIGLAFLANRRDFVAERWSPKCRCGHGSREHDPETKRCRQCRGCYSFESDFCCGVCDAKWEDHATLVETEGDRRQAKLSTGTDYLPLGECSSEFREVVFGKETAQRLPPSSMQVAGGGHPRRIQQQSNDDSYQREQQGGGGGGDSFLDAFPSKANARPSIAARNSFSEQQQQPQPHQQPRANPRVQEAPPAPSSAQQCVCSQPGCGVINRRLAKFCRACGAKM